MKINWFSPLPPANTGIAEYTFQLLPALKNHSQLVLWTNQLDWSQDLEKYSAVRYYQLESFPWAEINQGDINIYHIGNNPDFHQDIWQISLQCPGIVVLHDFKLQHFFTEIYGKSHHTQVEYIKEMRRYYSSEGEKVAKLFWNNSISIETLVNDYPLTPLAFKNALGVVVHTKEAYNILKQEDRWVVGYLPLPYASTYQLSSQNSITNNPPYKIIIFGYINLNRRLEIVLEALANFAEKSCFRLDIYGKIWDENYISEQIKTLGLSNLVTLHGFVPEIELHTALANADLALNLRYPTMGEASLSQLYIWSHGLPSLVTQVGWYAELHENTVAYVRIDEEIADIQKHLQSFLNNPKPYREMGKNSQQILQQYHNIEVYSKAIINIAEKASSLKSQAVGKYLIEKVGDKMSFWSNSELVNINIQQVSEAIQFIGF